jgi:hypothetical protein
MSAEQSVEEVQILLDQMSQYPDEILQIIGEEEQSEIIRELDMLAQRFATIRSGAGLLSLADAIHRLAEDRPKLRALLLPLGIDVAEQRSQRTVTLADQLVTTGLNTYAQERAPQICNAVIRCRTQLEAALQENAESKHKSEQGKRYDISRH